MHRPEHRHNAGALWARFLVSFLVLWAVLMPVLASGQTAVLLPNGRQQFLDSNGDPLASGQVFMYVPPATTTAKTTWQDSARATPNSNPILLDAAGTALIYGSGGYRQLVKDVLGNTIWDAQTAATGNDTGSNIYGGTSTGTTNNQIIVPPVFSGTNGEQVAFTAGFTNSGPMTLNAGTGVWALVAPTETGPSPLVGGEVTTGNYVLAEWDLAGSRFVLVTPPGTVATTNWAQTLTNKSISGGANTITGIPLTTGVVGNLPVTNLNSGTGASAATFWRGDGSWATPAGAGTVTNDNSLVTNSIVLGGAGGVTGVKVVASLVTDGAGQVRLGTAGSVVGSVLFANATSGTIALQPQTGALGTVTLSLPAVTDQLVGRTTTDTLTNKTLTSPVLNTSFTGSTAAAGTYGTLASTDTGATAGPNIELYRNSASPAISDILAGMIYSGEDTAGNTQEYASVAATILDPTSTSEDGTLDLYATVAGTRTKLASLSNSGLVVTGVASSTSTNTASAFIPSANTVPTNGMYLPAANTLGWAVNSAAETQLTATGFSPAANNGNALGVSGTAWADLFLASGGVVNWAAGDTTLTQSTGNLALGGSAADVVLDISATNAGQIKFPASPNSSASDNVLDEYAEETWTPAFSCSGCTFSYFARAGNAIKIGKLVYVNAVLILNNSGNTLTANALTITGLPYQSFATSYTNCSSVSWFASTTSYVQVNAGISGSSTAIAIYGNTVASTSSVNTLNGNAILHATNSSQIQVSCVYEAEN